MSNKKPVAMVLVGLPGSGKSTWAENHPKKLPIASTDSFIECYARDNGISYALAFQKHYDDARKRLKAQIANLMETGSSFIWDQTNLEQKERDAIYKILHKTHDVHFVCFLVPLEICIERASKRNRDGGNIVDEKRIRTLAAKAVFPKKGDLCDKIVLIIHPQWKKEAENSMTHWHINLLTLFPEMFPGMLGQSLSGKALEKGLWSYNAVNIRDFATDKHKTVDNTPFGGGAGMVMRADIIEKSLLSIPAPGRKIYLSPRGKPLTQNLAKELSQTTPLTLLCGRYEGVDQRILDAHGFEEISIGDYVLSGGEPAAMILMDACIRLLPGVMGNEETPTEESFSDGLLEYPHYTRPADWLAADGKTYTVPDILKSGDHAKIKKWRREQSEKTTLAVRPDLLKK